MKKKIIPFLMIFLSFAEVSCKAQEIKTKDLSTNYEMNYIFARLYNTENIIDKELYNRGLFVTIFEILDSKATPKEYFEDFLSSYIISVSPDGDYYSGSKLYKIEGLYNPKNLEIKETAIPINFSIKIEHGSPDNRKTDIFEFEEVQ